MTIKLLYRLIFLICLYGCSPNSKDYSDRAPVLIGNRQFGGEKQFGLYITNAPRQGMQYFDSAYTAYNYRYYTITITNDTLIPIHLDISFPESALDLKDSIRSKVFLLPRHLTPNEQHFDTGGMSKELKRFLDVGIHTPVYLSKTLKPTEKCTMTFGILTDRKYFDPTTPYDTGLLTTIKSSSEIVVELKINENLIIPCGHISYINK